MKVLNSFQFQQKISKPVARNSGLGQTLKPTLLNFNGTTHVYALTDSHQHTREKCQLLSRLIETLTPEESKRAVLLDNGDMFKGIYPPELEVEAYVKLKQKYPDLEIIVNIGNNDPGYDSTQRKVFKKALKRFEENGIHVLSANVKESEQKSFSGVEPYKLIERDGDKLLFVGFCINLAGRVPNVYSEESDKTLLKIADEMKKKKPDGIVFLNHDYLQASRKLVNQAKDLGIKVDFVINGHQHDITYFRHRNIFHPGVYGRSMINFNLDIQGNSHRIKDENFFTSPRNLMNPIFKADMQKADAALNQKVADYVMPLADFDLKDESSQSQIKTLVADTMRDATHSDMAIFSVGFIVGGLPEKRQGSGVTVRDLKNITSSGDIALEKVRINTATLKQLFENACEEQINGYHNSKSVAYSGNMIVERRKGKTKEAEAGLDNRISQIYLINKDGTKVALLDKAGNPLYPEKEFSCAIDPYIGAGNKGYDMLQDLPRERIDLYNGHNLTLNDTLVKGLKSLEEFNRINPGIAYPKAHIETIFI